MITAWMNRATNLTMAQAATIVRALQMQQTEFAQCWPDLDPCSPLLFTDEDDTKLPEGCYPCVFVDNPDIAGVLGYHSVTAGGRYFARIFVDLLLKEGTWNQSVSSCASHENLELQGNPTCLKGVIGPVRPEGSRYQYELCDPVEEDYYTKRVDGVDVSVSNFVLREYFDPNKPNGSRVDYLGTCPGPFQLAPKGYMLVSKDGLELPTPIYGERPPSPERIERKKLGHRFFGGLAHQ